jgi:two-component system, NtrC family, response regulator AtoC
MNSPVAMQSLVDLYAQPFAVIGGDRRVRLVNRAFENAYGVPRADAVGQSCHQLLHRGGPRPCPCGPDGANCPFQAVFAGGRDRVSVHTYESGIWEERFVQIQGHPLRTESGEILLGELIRPEEPAVAEAEAEEPGAGPRMAGDSLVFRRVLDRLRLAARSGAPVLLEGATGTGKELAADYIHRHSDRARGPFVTLSCTTLGGDLFESTVFGHERGALAGTADECQGLFERAHGGTLFLDEIGELPLSLQAKLLRAIENGEFRRVGSDLTRRADVRIVCTTNRDLRQDPGFRQDLYFRVACVRVRMPSLAERTEDIPALARELLLRLGASADRAFDLDPAALALLQAQPFPGNVRELRNVLWTAAMHSGSGTIEAKHVAAALNVDPAVHEAGPGRTMATAPNGSRVTAPSTLQELEARHLRDLLATHRGNRRAVAQALKVSERTVYRKLRRYALS